MTFDKLDKTFDIDSAIEEVQETSTEIKKLSDNKDYKVTMSILVVSYIIL